MKKTATLFIAIMALFVWSSALYAANIVTITYNGATATVNIDPTISQYVTCSSGNSSHVRLTQTSTSDSNPGEICYELKGSTTDGEFYMKGEYKCVVELNGVSITNPTGPALCFDNGKKTELSALKNTTNTIADGTYDAESAKGAIRCKGHLKIKSSGTLNVQGNTKHAIWSKEYVVIQKATVNITGAKNDGINCNQYFELSSGTLNISNVGDDGVWVSVEASKTAEFTGHESGNITEDSGSFYQVKGSYLNIFGYANNAIKAEGNIYLNGSIAGFTLKDNCKQNVTAVASIATDKVSDDIIYDLNGRLIPQDQPLSPGIYIVKVNGETKKIVVR